jgi:tetrahydromethanopterin S-methyltransferase subunit B
LNIATIKSSNLHIADGWLTLPVRKGVFDMVTYEAMNMLFQFGIFLATAITAVVAIIAFVTNKNKK